MTEKNEHEFDDERDVATDDTGEEEDTSIPFTMTVSTLYLRVLKRSERLQKLVELSAPSMVLNNEVSCLVDCVGDMIAENALSSNSSDKTQRAVYDSYHHIREMRRLHASGDEVLAEKWNCARFVAEMIRAQRERK